MESNCSHKIKRCMLLGRKVMTNLESILKSRDISLLPSVHKVKAMVSPVLMYGYESWDHKEGWAPKNQCFWTVVLEKTLESPLDSKEIKSVNPKGNQPWIFTRRTDAEVKAPIFWTTWIKELTHWEKPWCWERLRAKGERGNRGWDSWMAFSTQWIWFEQTVGESEEQESLVWCSAWGCKESDMV